MKDLLTTDEVARLKDLEKAIFRGKETFFEVGLALAEIKNGKLYRRNYDSFDDYCKKKWGWSSSRARPTLSERLRFGKA